MQLINETAIINIRETIIFPEGQNKIKINSNAPEPPHISIETEGWNVSFKIEDGALLEIKEEGSNRLIYTYIMTNIYSWLDAPLCQRFPTKKMHESLGFSCMTDTKGKKQD